MDNTSEIHNNSSSDDAVTLALNNLSLTTEVLSNESLGAKKDSAMEATLNTLPNINCNETSKTKPLVITENDLKARTRTQDCALTIPDDCCSLVSGESSLNSTYVVPDGMVSSLRDSINDKMKMDLVIRQNSHSNSHQRPNSMDCVITLYESSESDSSISDSESSYDSENADWLEYNNEKELSYTIKRKSLTSDGESTEESCNESEEDSSDSHEDSDDSYEISNESEDSSDSDKESNDSVSINDASDEEPTPSDDEAAEDSDENSSTTSEEKPDSDEESELCSDHSTSPIESSINNESSDDDKSVVLDESSESSSESSEDSD